MWQDNQANIILPGQTSFPQAAHVGNTILPPHAGNFDSDFLGGSPRKRKSIHLDPPRSTSEYLFPWNSNLRDDNSLLESNRQRNDQGLYSNQAKSVGPVDFTRQYDNQIHYQNDFSEPPFNSTSHRSGTREIGNASYNVPFQPLEPNGNMSVGDTHLPPIRQTQPSHVFSQTEVHRSLPLLNASNVGSGTSQCGFGFRESVGFESKNYLIPEKMPRDMESSDRRRPTETLQQSFVQPSRFSDGLIGKMCSQDDYKFEISREPKESVFFSKSGGVNDLEHVREVLGASICSEHDEKNTLLEKEVQSRGAPSGQCVVDNSESKERSSAEKDVKQMEITAEPGIEKPKVAFAGNNSSESRSSHDNTTGQGQKNNLTYGHLKPDEKTRLPSEKQACTAAEKLWDGSLQLSSSVTLSAVAFFKSGEKLLETNWPEFVEVKGKVRLEAFEKYIQDLPRSRNRGLMVISICWKEGSSVTGLNGLIEVARGYKKSARVGFAHLSPGTDLYICPRSDIIITILAKYGFFKGMAVIDDNQDSLIGCVVWKKSRPPSNPAGEKTDSKSSSSSKQTQSSNPETEFSPVRQAQELSHSTQATFIPSAATCENGNRNGTEKKDIDSSFLPITSAVQSNITPVPAGQQTPNNSYSPLINSDPHPFSSIRQPVPPAEDDDLPEYDFGVACGISALPLPPPPPPPPPLRLPPPPPRPPVSKPLQPVLPGSSENSSLPRIPSATNQTIHSSDSHLHVSMSEEKPNTSEVLHQLLAKKKNLFDDDDDMPEWCPPEHHSQSQPETIRPPIANTVPPRPPLPAIPPPTPTDTRSVFSYQPFRPAFSSPPSSIRPPQPLAPQSGASSSMGLPHPPMRPEFQFSDRRQHMP